MKIFFQKIKKFALKVRFLLPSALPRGMKEFDVWSSSIISVYGLPNNDSVKFALATMVLHAPSQAAYMTKHHFGMCALKSASNQIASGIMHELKEKQKAEIAEEAAAKAALEAAPASGAV